MVLGAGFGGLELAATVSDALGAEADVTVIDRRDSFVFGYAKLDVMFRGASLESLQSRDSAQPPHNTIARAGAPLPAVSHAG